jgi:hypothetical protein
MRILGIAALGAALGGCASSGRGHHAHFTLRRSPINRSRASNSGRKRSRYPRAAGTLCLPGQPANQGCRGDDGRVIVFCPAAFLVGGDKQTAAEPAQMAAVSIQKNCGIQFHGQRPPGT